MDIPTGSMPRLQAIADVWKAVRVSESIDARGGEDAQDV